MAARAQSADLDSPEYLEAHAEALALVVDAARSAAAGYLGQAVGGGQMDESLAVLAFAAVGVVEPEAAGDSRYVGHLEHTLAEEETAAVRS